MAETIKNSHFRRRKRKRISVGLYYACMKKMRGIAQSAMRQYLSYSEADFEVFCPAGATRCTDVGEIWRGGD